MGMSISRQTVGSVLCSRCGIAMQPNIVNMCATCWSFEVVDITEGLKKHAIIRHCQECDTYLEPPNTRISALLESREFLAYCINLLHLPNDVRMVNAEFVNLTEPRSNRIKLMLKIQKEVLSKVRERSFVAEFVLQETKCDACTRVDQANPDDWAASVQLRQHVPDHRRTFFFLEQLILNHDAAVHAIKIKQMDHGIDFFFGNRSHGVEFVQFISQVAPVKSRCDRQLVSNDTHTSPYNYKYTFSVEICPICREDLICLPPNVGRSLGNLGPIVICTKVTNKLALLDPLTLKQCYLDVDQYWRTSFKSLLTSRQLVEYIILDVEITSRPEVNIGGSNYALAEVTVARLSDFGRNDNIFLVKTHLGNILKPGDQALGYDMYGATAKSNIDLDLDMYGGRLVLPEAILIRKSYKERKCGKPCSWKLKSLNMEVDESRGSRYYDPDKANTEYEEFLRDLEENPDLRLNVSLYRNKEYQPSEMASSSTVDGEDIPSIPLDELLVDPDISDMKKNDEDDGTRE